MGQELDSSVPDETTGAEIQPETGTITTNTTGPDNQIDEGMNFAKKFESLTAHEKKLRLREEELKAQSEEYTPIKETLELLKTKPIEALKKLGWEFKDLVDMVLNDSNPTTEKRIEQLENRIKTEAEEREAKAKEAEEKRKADEEAEKKQNYERQVEQIKDQINKYCEETEELELIRTNGQQELVWDVIQEVYQQTGQTITIEDAAKRVEDYLTEEAEKNFNTNKFQSRFKKVEPKEADQEPTEGGPNHYMRQVLNEKFGRSLSTDMQSEGGQATNVDRNRYDYRDYDDERDLLVKKFHEKMGIKNG